MFGQPSSVRQELPPLTAIKPRLYTFTGKLVNPLQLNREDVCLEDIAHALALANRFAGHTRFPISVAHHSVWVSRLVSKEHALQGLLHDGAEAYLGDVTKWVKAAPEMTHFREAEKRAQQVIFEAFGLPVELAHEVEVADRLMVRYEGTQGYGDEWLVGHPAYPAVTAEEKSRLSLWLPQPWETAEKMFLVRYHELRGDLT